MIYLVSNQTELFQTDLYTRITPEEAIQRLSQESILGADTETEGLSPYTKKLLTIQLGTEDYQVVWDCTSVDIQLLKPILESENITTIWWNAKFDLQFLYHQRIIPKKIYDGMLAEKLLWLGYPAQDHEMSLKAAVENYCGEHLDKSVRGRIITKGLSPEVIVYAARDVAFEIPIYTKQMLKIKAENLAVALQMENEFVRCLAYIEYCGVKLDVEKWKSKMAADKAKLDTALSDLNNWLIDFYKEHKNREGYIAYKVLRDSQFRHPGDKELDGLVFIEPNPKWKVLENHSESSEQYGLLYYTTYEIPFSCIYKEAQGDLFSGFNTDYQCDLNWSSPKQIIPIFELLGFNLETFDKKTKIKKKSVESKIIEPQVNVSPIAPLYLKYKESEKVVSTYGEKFLKAINAVSGRIHPSFNQLMNTGRLSSGGGEESINIQNLPHDALTRSCFIAEEGNDWISCDYQSQESRLIASIANDASMIDEFLTGSGDIHSLVAKMSYPDIIPTDCAIKDIKKNYPKQRQDAKGIEFAINYGGDAHTIANNKGIPIKEAEEIYQNFMKGFPGVSRYQDFCRADVMRKGYILLSPVTGHKSYIPDWEFLHSMQIEMKEDPDFWDNYRYDKSHKIQSDLVYNVRRYFKLKSQYEKASINYRIQGAGALCFKLASIKLFRYLESNNLLFIVKYCVPAHDELNIECPKEMTKDIEAVLLKCMEEGAKPFCTRVPLGADASVGPYWIH